MSRTLIAVTGVLLAANATCARGASLPGVASAEAPTPSATEHPLSPRHDAAIAPMTLMAPAAPPSSRVHFDSQKWIAPQLQRSEAGITWSLNPMLRLELNYERSALPPMMSRDHDDGFLTRLRVGF